MNVDELLEKLDRIEEQARLAIEEYPEQVRKERQRAILALAKEIRIAVGERAAPPAADAPAPRKLRVT